MDTWTAAQTQKPNAGRGRGKNSNGKSPHGIKKLRELILDLAVRGKLVPQDPDDEPAIVLLENTGKEKARLIKEGEIKRQKSFPEIGEDEKPFDLPEGWEWFRVGEAFDFQYGKALPAKSRDDSGDVDVYGSNGIVGKHTESLADKQCIVIGRKGSAGALNKALKPSWTTDVAYFLIPPVGFYVDYALIILQALRLEKLGKGIKPGLNRNEAYILVGALPPLTEQHRIVAKVHELIALCDQLEQQQTDSNAAHQTLVETLLITLTNTPDQGEFAEAWQRIADHFDTLFTTEQSIDHLKQTILQLAIMGKLVPQDPTDLPAPVHASHADGPQSGKFFVYALECEDKSIYIGQTDDVLERWKEHATGKGADWTKKHPPLRLVHWEEYNSREEAIKREKELKTGFGRKWIKRELAAGRTRQAGEPSSVLLKRIAKEKARLIKEGKIKKPKPLPEIGEDEKLFDLPEGWEFVRLERLCKLITKGSSPKWQGVAYTDDPEDVLFITSENVGSYVLKLASKKYVEKKFNEVERRSILEKGDFLMNIVGASIGRTAIYNIDDLANINQAVCLIRVFCQLLNSQFLLNFFNSKICLSYMFDKQVDNARANLSMGNIAKFVIPLPPQAEQHHIVAKVDELMAVCDTLKVSLNDAQTTQVQLADAIVEQAVT